MKNRGLLIILACCFNFTSHAQLEDAWIYLTDKQNVAASLANPLTILTQKAIDRKALHGVAIDESDVPVNETYMTQIKNTSGITVLAKSKWFNALHVRGLQADIQNLSSLAFVSNIDFADNNLNAKTSKVKTENTEQNKLESNFTIFNYGDASPQIEMFNGDKLHLSDYTGTGMTVAVLDSGFPNVHTMTSFEYLRNAGNLLGAYDFVNRDPNVYTGTTSSHGTLVLSTMAGFVENEYVGTAPDAGYYLFITEDGPNENPVEESYWVEAVERADSLGVDVINTSLGYTTFDNPNYNYAPSEMDGYTAYITKGANIAFEKGLLLVTSAGNSGNAGVGAPADSPNVLSIGAVNASGNYASFSSVGSAIQPTQKPDIVAQGQASAVINENDALGTANGTSFSSPIIAGGIVCLWQALPNKTNAEIMQLVSASASQYTTPDYLLGYGIPNLELALNTALSVEKDERLDLKMYPNPVKDRLHIQIPSRDTAIHMSLYDILGKEIQSHAVSNGDNTVDVSRLPKGVYILTLASKHMTKTFKLIKQ